MERHQPQTTSPRQTTRNARPRQAPQQARVKSFHPSYASRTEREDAADLNYDRHSENGERAEPAGEHFVRTVMEDHASIPDANEADCHALG
jgi:hypothetical protein